MKTKPKGKLSHMKTVEEFLSDLDDSDTVCKICMAEFVDPEDLLCHISGVHQNIYNNNNFCKWCFESLPDVEEFALHIRDNHLSYLTICPYCFRFFSNYYVYKVHKAKHLIVGHKNTVSCSNCPCLFKDSVEVTKHEYDQHQNAEGIMINHCFPHLSSVLNMWITWFFKGNLDFYCCACSYRSTELNEYIKHVQSCGKVSFVCNNCFKTFNKREILSKHIKLNRCKIGELTKKRSLECRVCYNSFPKELLQEHSENCLKCCHCNEIFNDISELANHQATHKSLTATLLYCKYCTASYISNDALERHLERSHNHELHLYKYICKTCDVFYKHPKCLFRHFYGKHKDLMPFKCRICNLKFKTRKSFTIHIKVVHKSNGTVMFDENFHVYFTRGAQDVNIHDHDYGVKDIEINNIVTEENNTELPANNTSNLENNDTNSVVLNTALENVDNSMEVSNLVDIAQDENSSDDDRPLSLLKGQPVKKNGRKCIKSNTKNNRFTCTKCNIQCYTFQHYNRHMSLHSSKISKQCVKCNELFKRTKDLEEHVKLKHSHSQLTDTLKKLLERRKIGKESVSEKFRRTIKKVYHMKTDANVKITEYSQCPNVTVKNFLENFTDDLDTIEKSSATVSVIINPIHREPVIKLTEVGINSAVDVEYEGKLKMPTRVTQDNLQICNVIVKVHEDVKPKKSVLNFGHCPKDDNHVEHNDNYEEYTDEYMGVINDDKDYEVDIDDKNSISTDFTPEASHEISLRDSAHQQNIKVVIPNVPLDTKLKIGCLTPQSPYFNIVSVNKILEETKLHEDDDISLPNGEKLVNVNPLEHLLVGKNVNIKVNKSKKKYVAKDAIKNALIRYKLLKPGKKSNVNKKASISNDDDAEDIQSEP